MVTRGTRRARRWSLAGAPLLAPSLAALLAGLLVACAISRQDEVAMGADYAARLEATVPIVQDAEVNRYLAVLGDSIAAVSDARDLTWRFRLVNSEEVNAYSIPGGYVYVTRGLVARTERMNQFAGVVAHEVAHVARRHLVKQMERAQQTDMVVALGCVLTGACGSDVAQAGIQIGEGAVMARYSRADEAEADADAVRLLVRAEIDPRGIPSLFERLLAERQSRPRGVEAWFATHPTEEARITATRAVIAEYPSSTLEGLREDSRAFAAFRQRVGLVP